MTKENLITLLSKDAYQVELGPGGRNLSQIQMEEIKNLNLPGIDFVKNTKRYYPNGDFASYMIGYTKTTDNITKGEMGIEEYFNNDLTGSAGYITYEKDRYGYKIANGREYIEDAVNGNNIYLTIDNNIELFRYYHFKSYSKLAHFLFDDNQDFSNYSEKEIEKEFNDYFSKLSTQQKIKKIMKIVDIFNHKSKCSVFPSFFPFQIKETQIRIARHAATERYL